MPRSKPHFKVRTTIANHEKMGSVWPDNDMLAMWVRLGVLAIERFADRTEDTFLVSDRELNLISGKGRADVARKSLEHLADISPISVERRGDVWRITIPNLRKKQGFKWNNSEEEDPSASPPAPTATPTTKRTRESEPASPSPLLNLLSKLPGKLDEKAAWLDAEFPLIEAEAERGSGSVKTLTIRYYRQYSKTPQAERKYFDFARRARIRAKASVLQAEGLNRNLPAAGEGEPQQDIGRLWGS